MDAEVLKHIELIVGSIGVIMGVFFSTFLFATRGQQHRANIFLAIYLLAFSLRIGKSLFHNYFEIDAAVRTFFLTTLLCVGPSIWLYTLYLIKPETSKKFRDYVHFIPFAILVSICWLIPNDGTSQVFSWFYDFLTAHMFGYTLFSFIWLKRQRNNSVLKKNRGIGNWLNYFLTINLVLIVLYFLISQLIISFYIGLSFLFSMTVILLSFWVLKNPFILNIPLERYKRSNLDSNDAVQLMLKLKAIMAEEKPHLDPSLTLLKLSAKMNASTKELSQAINQIEALNYSQFISRYRVEEAQSLMRSKSHSKLTIAAIAYDSGFNSISSFNTAFKKYGQTTAIAYRKYLKVQ